ncbi:translation initiation factor IF-3 [Treponema pallidum]|uniref:Translation initiation factor IF-3 n=2 Tax=Treponema pallidum TaxID=160 RepID=A0AAU8RRK8_TREPL|nr:initiation factor IF3 [Treponema pallidum subsp. pertenue str. SamoaD]AEZ59052.1 initiation factor IF3 [Treponema pallidum subsp. pertenue str. CDC2]AEZ60120.1 initiation factor IF3 [Treponema pallidum subsp. pertenue str. Gauthier]AEZ61180.1 initiation factor IF3 [Treponema pallidum subsp. pallidum DAL-1]AGK84504.1 initiation factor IF3 [Treponema pallidum str. Fribourg-Blanc]AHN67504.1 translation initiation factor IF-3 [Treponema pallidum subsp. pallidum str. Sea 81-4]AJB40880.1 initiat
MADNKSLRINGSIRVREVRLVDAVGQQCGVVPTPEALRMARDINLDLVEVAPQASPPVCKILDYGKYRFEMGKKLRDSKKRQRLQTLKEVRMQPKINDHDMAFKAKHIQRFLDEGDKVKVTIRFRGRELAHTDLGFNVLQNVLGRLVCGYSVEKQAAMEGRSMSMTLTPKSKK